MIFNWLYRRRVRALFQGLMPPHAIEECLPPKLTEWQALGGLLHITFPSYFIARTDANDLVRLKNELRRSLNAQSGGAEGASSDVPSNHTPHPDARETPPQLERPTARADGRER
jgi:hypothetical protein